MDKILTMPPMLESADTLENILCLSVLIATGKLSPDATLHESSWYFEHVAENDCSNCPLAWKCMACIINE